MVSTGTFPLDSFSSEGVFSSSLDEIKKEDVHMPTPLKATRANIYDHPDPGTFSNVSKSKEGNAEHPKVISERKAKMRALLPHETKQLKISRTATKRQRYKIEKRNPPERSTLVLTKVSVPKNATRKLPIFDHCMQSIRKGSLPNVLMEPLQGSEHSSTTSLPNIESRTVDNRSFSNTCYTMKAPASSPTSEYIDPVYSSINRHVSSNSNLKSILSKESDPKSEHCKRSEVVSFQLDQGDKPIYHYEKRFIEQRANTAPSSIMISRASQSFSAFEQRSNSPTFSIASKFGSEDSNLEREFIKRTYEKYQSLTPFKTPLGSEHVIIEEDIPGKKATNNRSPIASRRIILQESKQNLNQYLPDENQTLLSNASFTTRSLSPSRSMFIRQQKQPSEHLVPGEIIVSQISLNPSRTKLQNNSERSILSSDRRIRNKMIQVLETIKSPVLGPPPTPNIYYKIEDSIDMVSKANDSAIAISIGEINTAGIKKISITKSVSSDSSTESQNSEAGLKPSLLKFEDLVQKEEDEELLRVHTFLSDESNILEENCSNTKIKSTESNKQTSSFAKERPGNMHFDQNVLGEDNKLVLYPEHLQISLKKSSDSDISKISESKSTSDVTETSQSKSTQDLNGNTDKASDLMESHYQNIDNVDSSMKKEKKESLKPAELIKSFESKLSLHFMPAIGGESEPTNVVNEVTSSSNVMDQLVKSCDEITEPITAKESTNTNLDKNSREAAQLSDEVNVDRHLQFPSLADPSVSQDHASSPVSTETVIPTITSTNTVIGASTSNHLLPTEKSSSVLKEFEMNLTKSVSFGEIKYRDFTEGLALDLELDEEIMKAMNETEFELESFISDD